MSVDKGNPNPKSMADDDLPDWLREIRGASSKPKSEVSAQPSPAPKSESSGHDDDDLPSWLKEVDAEAETSTDTALEEISPASLAEEDSQDDDLWTQILAEEGVDLGGLPEERPEGAENKSVREWLAETSEVSPLAYSNLSDASSSDIESTEEPDFESELVPLEIEEADVEEELPDWLRSDQPVETEASSVSWLTDEAVYEETDEEAAEAAIEPTASAEEIETEEVDLEEELPDWLRSDQPVETEASSVSWLTDEAAYEETDEETAEAIVEDDELGVTGEVPDWLYEDQLVQADTEAPAWLVGEITTDEAEEAAAPEITAPVDLDDGIVVTEELPDWLRDEQPLEQSSDSLAWLSDEATYDDSPVEAKVDTADVTDEDDLSGLDREELPDWLQEETEDEAGMEVVSDAAEVAQPAAEDLTTSLEDDGLVDMDGLPDWLRDEQDLTIGEEEETEQQVPAWLAEAESTLPMKDEDESLTETDIPDWLREVEQEEVVSTTLQADKAPEWLDTSTVEEDVLGVEYDVEAGEIAVESSKVPTWLEKLRSGEKEIVSEGQDDDWVAEEQAEEEALSGPPVAEPLTAVQPAPIAEAALSTEGEEKAPDQESATAKLSVALATLGAGDLDEALTIYQDLITGSQFLDNIIEVLSTNLERYKDVPAIYETLGDAQVRNGQLNNALESYRLALEKL